MIIKLDGNWNVRKADGEETFSSHLPVSVYDVLIKAKKIPDPYFGENQYNLLKIADSDYIFEYDLNFDESIENYDRFLLRFNGIDTVSQVYFNGNLVGHTENMHRTYEFDVTDLIAPINKVTIRIFSPTKYIEEQQEKNHLWGVDSTLDGFPHIRKAHYMFGWDWGPAIPDIGIWRGAELVCVKGGRIDSVYVRQNHYGGNVRLSFETKLTDISSDKLKLDINITSPDGEEALMSVDCSGDTITNECVISSPVLWNVRGYGKQALYMIRAMLYSDGEPVDIKEFNIGLRTVEVCRAPDAVGEEFCFKVNGIKIFAMGANYIPEDNILPNRSLERTKRLLQSCAAANFNMIRVWGGGIYPDDSFYDICDRLGILVWQDFAFACAVYDANTDFSKNIRQEFIDNVKRLRNHPSLAMWCGNNEIESAIMYWGIPVTEEQKQGYLRIFEKLIPNVVKHYDPQRYYHPSSPSSGGGFSDPSSDVKGDTHYWAMWHNFRPASDFMNYRFRFCSEFGFESIPCMKTVRSFAGKDDLNLMSPVMEAHQKCDAGNEKLLYYLAQNVHYPYTFEDLVYASQLVQADSVKICVEHLRRNRGVCMGSLYWQLNDSNPVISWSSIDYFGRWKALHYYAKRFYAPILCSIDDRDKEKLLVCITNENTEGFSGSIRWRVRKNDTTIISHGALDIAVPPTIAASFLELTPELTKVTPEMYRNCYIEYSLVKNNAVISGGTYMFIPPKEFRFLPPEIEVKADQVGELYRFSVTSKNFAKGVYLDFDDFDCPFRDNWFDLHGQLHSVLVSKAGVPANLTVRELEKNIKVKSYYDLVKGG